MKSEILVIDDNPDIRFLICNILKDSGYLVRSAANFDQAIIEINKKLPDLSLVDIKLDKSDKDGIELLKKIKKINKSSTVIMISGHANVQLAVEAIRLGAYEFIEKPFSSEKILNYVKRALENNSLLIEKEHLENKLFHSFKLIGDSPEMVKIKKLIDKLSSTDSRILITGETGTGKELIARKIHKNSNRSMFPFVVLNAALLKDNKYERVLFGEEFLDGSVSFGILEQANKGSLLVDEIAEVPMDIQANILRILVDQKFKRINGKKDIKVNIRIISSTSKNLKTLCEQKKFREDFYHRLNVVPIDVPSLTSRSSDIPLLINYFSKIFSNLNVLPAVNIDTNNDLLYNYGWPGNIRELRNLIERVTILAVNEESIDFNKVINDILSKNSDSQVGIESIEKTMSYPLKEAREQFEIKYLMSQLKKNSGNISKTADNIGMERSALHRKLKSLGIKGLN
jgi:two-component system nitrogen regulation response regulator NtrX